MLEIKQTELHEIELMLNQSMKGYHFLFDHKKVAQILRTPTEGMDIFNKANLRQIQDLLTGLLSKKYLHEKQSYLDSLTHKNFELLVRTYFHIVDSTMIAATRHTH